MTILYSCAAPKKSDDMQLSQKTADSDSTNSTDKTDSIENNESAACPYIGMAAVKEGTITCYRDGSNLMCKNGTNPSFVLVKNIEGQFMISNQCVYYFTHNSDLHKIDINSQKDTLMVRHIGCSFIGAYKNSIYLYPSNHSVHEGIIMVTENESRELYKTENDSIYFAAILKGQLFIIADNPNEEKSYSYLSKEDTQIIYKIDLDTKEKQLEKITTCKLPRLLYTEYVQNVVLSDGNVIYYLNMVKQWDHSHVKEVEIIRIDETGTTESLIKKEEPLGLSFLIDGTVVYYCLREQIYEQAGQEFLNLRNEKNKKEQKSKKEQTDGKDQKDEKNEKDGKDAGKILCYGEKYYWYESDVDDNFGIIYCYNGQNVFPFVETASFILDIAIIDQTLYYCVDLNPESSEEIGYFIDL